MSARSRRQKTEAEKVEVSPHSILKSVERSKTSTPEQRVSFSKSERSNSPLNASRVQEKEELAYLNDRFADYITHVRNLEQANQQLTERIHSITEERMVTIDDSRKIYEKEISDLRLLVDNLSKQKTKAELEAKQAQDDLNGTKSKLNKRDQENRTLQKKVENLEKDLIKYKQDYDAYQPLLADYHLIEKNFEDTKQKLDSEVLIRSGLENKILSLKEQLDFHTRLFDEERGKWMEKSIIIEEQVNGRKQAEYDNKLAEELRLIREETAIELEGYKAQMEEAFETKLEQMKSATNHDADTVSRQRSELLISRKRIDELNHELSKKIAENNLLERRIEDLERQLNDDRKEFESQLAFQRSEIDRLKGELEESFRNFVDLTNTKIALDQEIIMYGQMLESEESRLKIKSRERDSPFTIHSGKRRRIGDDTFGESGLAGRSFSQGRVLYSYHVSATCGPIVFAKEHDTEGKFVQLSNTTDEEVSIGNWELVHQSGGLETRHKFARALVLKPKSICNIWSQDGNGTNNPPSDIVMKNKNFKSGAEVTLQLLDADGKEKAKYTVKRERVRATGPNRCRKNGRSSQDDKCMIM